MPKSHFDMGASCKFAAYFQNTFPMYTSDRLLLVLPISGMNDPLIHGSKIYFLLLHSYILLGMSKSYYYMIYTYYYITYYNITYHYIIYLLYHMYIMNYIYRTRCLDLYYSICSKMFLLYDELSYMKLYKIFCSNIN